MSHAAAEPDLVTPLARHVLDAVAAGLWPAMSTADRREKARQALDLVPAGPWPGGRMVYIEAASE